MMPEPMMELMKLKEVIGMELRGFPSSFSSIRPRVSLTLDASDMSDIVCGREKASKVALETDH